MVSSEGTTWLLMKDAGQKAAKTRKLNVIKKMGQLSVAAKRAWESRKRSAE
jgi:hypothetical protein